MKIHVSRNPASEAGAYISRVIAFRHSVLFLVSGGSSLAVLEHINTDVCDKRMAISLIDERYTYDPAGSNFATLEATPFFSHAVCAGALVINPQPAEHEGLFQTASRIEAAFRAWRKQHPDGAIVGLFGVGIDGHTAGILPMPGRSEQFEELFLNTDRWVVGHEYRKIDNPYLSRITVTPPFIQKEMHEIVVFASGEDKSVALHRMFSDRRHPSETPAKMLDVERANLFTDCTLPEAG